MRQRTILGVVVCGVALWTCQVGPAGAKEFNFQKNYYDMTPAEHTAAKRAAKTRKFSELVACADPGNMPLSNNKGEGFQNKIMKVVAEKMGASLRFFWRPFLERGLTRETFANKECRILVGMPTDHPSLLTTAPIYASTYVFVYRNDSSIRIEDLDDPILRTKRVGVFQHSGLREALRRHGIQDELELHIISYDADLNTQHQPWRQVQQVVDGALDIAGVWGPFAGLLKAKGAPITLQPANLMDDVTPLEFSMSIGMQKTDAVLKYALDNALEAARDEIEAILRAYGVPLVQCSKCAVQGDLKSHGSYYKRFLQDAQKRFLQPPDPERVNLSADASPDQVVTPQRLETWLKEGADLDRELGNAVLAADHGRIRLLIGKGADPNRLDAQGAAAVHIAARNRDSETLKLLLSLEADANLRDRDGWTPVFHAAFRNHKPSIEVLAAHGADLEAVDRAALTPLGLAISERNFFAVGALLAAGVSPNGKVGPEGVTPLMLVATQKKAFKRAGFIVQGIDPVRIAEDLIERGADVDTVSKSGVTALMIAAGHDNSAMIGLLYKSGADLALTSSTGKTALDIAKEARHDAALKSLKLFASLAAAKRPAAKGN